MQSLEELAVLAVPNPGEIARQFFSPWQTVRMALEEREYSEMREEYRKEHAKKFRYVMKELKYVDDYNWTWSLFPSHVLLLLPSNFSVFLLRDAYQPKNVKGFTLAAFHENIFANFPVDYPF